MARPPFQVSFVDPSDGAVLSGCVFVGPVPAKLRDAIEAQGAGLPKAYRLRGAADSTGGGDHDLGGLFGAKTKAKTTASEFLVYEEDSVQDLNRKLFAATGIEPWRQCLFGFRATGGPEYVTRTVLDGAPMPADWRELADPAAPRVASTPIGSTMYADRKDGFETALTDGTIGERGWVRACCVDLLLVLRDGPELRAAAADRYQLDLLWYGLVARYWPDATRDHVAAPEPSTTGRQALIVRFRAERTAAEQAHAWKPARGGWAITGASAAASGAHPFLARAAFEQARLGGDAWAATVAFDVSAARAAELGVRGDGPAAGGAVPMCAAKRHVSTFGARRAEVDAFLRAPPPPGTCCLLVGGVAVSLSGVRTAARQTWRDTENTGPDTALALCQSAARRAAALCRAPALARADDLQLEDISVCMHWPRALDMASLRAALEPLAAAGVLETRGLVHSAALVYTFTKGVRRGGLLTRVTPRATDVRVEVVAAGSLAELRLLQRYMFSALDRSRPARPDPTASRLRRLQEIDPVLFDLKAHDNSSPVYSVLCQSTRQPQIFAPGEKRPAGVVAHPNRTTGQQAYYNCPDRKYPYLSFRPGKHPLGFCLPCCKKMQPLSDESGEACDRLAADGDHTGTASQHILAYGKTLPEGRLGAAPPAMGLLFDEQQVLLLGTPQDHGRAGCVLKVLALSLHQSVPELCQSIAAEVRLFADYQTVGNGAAATFATVDELADAVAALGRPPEALTPFGPGGHAEHTWGAIFEDIVFMFSGVCVVPFVDSEQRVTLEASEELRIRLQGGALVVQTLRTRSGAEYLVYVRGAWLLGSSVPDTRWIVDRLLELIRVEPERLTAEWLHRRVGPRVSAWFLDAHDRCHGALVDRVFVPTVRSAWPTQFDQDTPNRVAARPDPDWGAGQVRALMAELGVQPAAVLTHQGRTVGVLADGLYYFHRPEDGDQTSGRLAVVELPYDTRALDTVLLKTARDVGLLQEAARFRFEAAGPARRAQRLGAAVTAELASVLSRERNARLRHKLAAVLARDWDDPAAADEGRQAITALLGGAGSPDLMRVRELTQHPAPVQALAAARFEFDMTSLETLAARRDPDRLRELLKGRLDVGAAGGDIPNVYEAGKARLAVTGAELQTYLELLYDTVADRARWVELEATVVVFDQLEFTRVPSERLWVRTTGAYIRLL